MEDLSRPTSRELRLNGILFALLVAVFCGWVLSLPVFPSQDGPAHKFYAGVLGKELFGDAYGNAYTIRLPVPPYASQDYILALASRVMDIDLAEKLFVCLIVAGTAYAVRLCCLQLGPSGAWGSLFVMPLLVHWPLLMGYMNYSFGLALMLLCFGLWMRADSGGGGPRNAGLFAAAAVLLTFSHPVALLMLLLLCGYDLLTRVGYARAYRNPLPRAIRIQCLGMVFLCCALAYPLLHTDRSRSRSDIGRTMFRLRQYGSDLTLHGLSPFYRHSWNVFINLYRLELYLLLGGAVLFAAWGLRRRMDGKLERTDFLLLAAALLYIVIPLMPNSINGAIDFFLRMLVLVWLLCLLAASRSSLPARGRGIATIAAMVFAAGALIPAEMNLRPMARQLAALDHLPLPPNAHGLLLYLDGDSRTMPGMAHNLETNPYIWSAMVPLLNAHDVPINGPWLDAGYLALAPGPDPKLLYNIVGTEREREDLNRKVGNVSVMTPQQEREALAAADFIFAIRNRPEHTDLSSQLGSAGDAFQCTVNGWYLLCFPRAAR